MAYQDIAHVIVDDIYTKKKNEEARKELLQLANEDIDKFIMTWKTLGFKEGIKTGFLCGLFVVFIIYLIFG